MPAFQKGSIASGAHARLREAYGEDAWARVLATMSDEDYAVLDAVDKSATYPMAVEGRLFRAIGEQTLGGDRSCIASDFRAHGRSQADTMLEGLFSVFARFVTPNQAFARAGSMIAAAYSGDVASETEKAADGKGGSITIMGLGEVDNLSPWLCGWMQRAVERFGGNDVRVTERSWDAGRSSADALVFDISWS